MSHTSSIRRSFCVFIIPALFLVLLSGCGGSSDSGFLIPPQVTEEEILEGIFVDSAVSGLTYYTASGSGVTNIDGKFSYEETDETITFSIAGIVLGRCAPKEVLTPVDLVDGAVDETDPAVTNICRLLLFLDSDGNPDNGITVTDEIIQHMVNNNISLDIDDFKTAENNFENNTNVQILINIMNAGGLFDDGDHALPTPEAARSHLAETLSLYGLVDLDPEASIVFPASTITITTGGSVYFQGAATGGNPELSYAWDFGNGQASSELIPEDITFSTAGDYTVTFTVTDSDGDTSSATVLVTVTEENTQPFASIISPADNASITAGGSVYFQGACSGGNGTITYAWVFGNGQTSTELTPGNITYADADTYTVTFTATDQDNEIDTATVQVTVTVQNTQPDASIISPAGNASITAGGSVYFQGACSGGNGTITYAWDFGNGQTSTELTPGNITFADADTYTVTFTATDQDNESDTATVQVTVTEQNTQPDASIISPTGNISITLGESVYFQGVCSGGNGNITYAWDFDGDGTTDSYDNDPGNYIYSSAGTYTVTFRVTDSNYLNNTDSIIITVIDNGGYASTILYDQLPSTIVSSTGSTVGSLFCSPVDNFLLEDSSQINMVVVYGQISGTNTSQAITGFRIEIWDDDENEPNSKIYDSIITSFTVESNGLGNSQYSIPIHFYAIGGEKYWLAIRAVIEDSGISWSWTEGENGDNDGLLRKPDESFSAYNSTGILVRYDIDMAFRLISSSTDETNANIASIQLSSGTIIPDSDETEYNFEVANEVSAVSFIVILANNNASCTVNGNDLGSGEAFDAALSVGQNTFLIVVTAEDGTTTKTYTLNVIRNIATLGMWIWEFGDNQRDVDGVYGTKGIADASNTPGSRASSNRWIENNGTLWVFGGNTSGGGTLLNDLWKFDGNNWTWVSGDNTTNQSGVYGTKGIPVASNKPGARHESVSWIDESGDLWLFGGYGIDNAGNIGNLNDLWKFDGDNWTWVSGDNTIDQSGVYGSKGVATSSNKPGSRSASACWTDSNGIFWLFGGIGYDYIGYGGYLNDLWKFDGTNWTWISGDNTVFQRGVYGTQGVAAEINKPGSRSGCIGWIDSIDNLWLFGGGGYDSDYQWKCYNDLWKFDGESWTWVSGDNTMGQIGVYGIKGYVAALNKPGARINCNSWIDQNNNLWLLGGYGYGGVLGSGMSYLNDMWKFDGNNWTWMHGDNITNQSGDYGTQGVADSSNKPGARDSSICWKDNYDNLWLFGGYGYDLYGSLGYLNDLWRYEP